MFCSELKTKQASISKDSSTKIIQNVQIQKERVANIFSNMLLVRKESQSKYQGHLNNNFLTAQKQRTSMIIQNSLQKANSSFKVSAKISKRQNIWNTTIAQHSMNLMFRQIQKFTPITLNPQCSMNQAYNLKIERSSFQCHFMIGKGGYGKVWKVSLKKNGKEYAMKQMFKQKIIAKKSIKQVMNQRNILSRIESPFIGNLHYAFHDRQVFYLITDYANGGDLRFFLNQRYRFSQVQVKFIIANLIIALQFLRKEKIIHRDIKPQNIMFCKNGYLKLIDFGTSLKNRSYNRFDSSGTPTYMAPQILNNKKYSFEVDYYAIGVICFELMTGYRPFHCNDRVTLRQRILIRQFQVLPGQVPKQWDRQSISFINGLLKRKPQQRLGHKGIEQIKRHPWFKDIEWEMMQEQKSIAPFIPTTIEQNYIKYSSCMSSSNTLQTQNQGQLKLMTRNQKVQKIFEEYDFNKEAQKNKSQFQYKKFQAKQIQQQDKISPYKIQLLKQTQI